MSCHASVSRIAINGKMLENIMYNSEAVGDGRLAGFLSMVGHGYDNTLMVAGRAVNAWAGSWDVGPLRDPAARKSFFSETLASETRRSPKGNACPMRWVADYWKNEGEGEYTTARSASERMIKVVVGGQSPMLTRRSGWPAYLVWSNLYKASPYGEGSPLNTLCSLETMCRVSVAGGGCFFVKGCA